jgi:hypothetical protein
MSKRYIVVDSSGDVLVGNVENRYPEMGRSTEAIIFSDREEAEEAMEEVMSPLQLSVLQLCEDDEVRVAGSASLFVRGGLGTEYYASEMGAE